MRIGIIGQPCIDEIFLPDADARSSTDDRSSVGLEPKQSLGGVLYSYAAMERLMNGSGRGDDTFLPLTWLSIRDEPILNPLLEKFPHLDRTVGLWRTDSLTNRVQLRYSANGSRTEHCPNVLQRLTGFQLSNSLLSSLNGLFINMISGFDVALDTLQQALEATTKRPYVHLDIHALVLGPLSVQTASEATHGGGRKPRGVRKWKHWLNLADSVQMNEMEVEWLGDPEVQSEEALLRYLERQRDRLRLKHLIITRAAKGATLYDIQSGENQTISPPPLTPVDTTGSGDVFGSAFIYSMIGGKGPVQSLTDAVRMATWCATLPTINDILTAPLLT